jgi:hypothetical protein
MWTTLRFSCVPLALLPGCYYTTETIGDNSGLDAIITMREPDREFDDLRTFAMPESVADLSNLLEDPEPLSDNYDQSYIDRVAERLADYGWVRVGDTADADVLVLNGKVAAEYWVTSTYWYPYYPYYIYYPYYYYPYYSYNTVTVNFPVGTLITVMLKPDEISMIDDGNESVPAIWTATGIVLLESNDATKDRVERMVDQSFEQSDYLVVGDAVEPVLGLDVQLP